MSIMYKILKRLSDKGNLTSAMKQKAISLNWITEEEAQTL